MVRFLYVDNFRGFKDTVLPLKDVNFLVGENSTGKTSLLALIHILHRPAFWMSIGPSLESEEVRFGSFNDMVSDNARDKTYFRVGLLAPNGGGESRTFEGYLITFKENRGMPSVSRYTFLAEGKQIHVRMAADIRWKSEEPTNLGTWDLNSARDIFASWVREHLAGWAGYKPVRRELAMAPRALALLNGMLLSQEPPVFKRSSQRGTQITARFGWVVAFEDMVMLAPIRSRPKPTYDEYNLQFSSEGAHTPYLIRNYLRARKKKEAFLKFIRKYGEESGVLRGLSVKNYGRGVTSPFELDVILEQQPLKILNVGYGVSQVLPVVTEIFARGKNTCFLIQQPEVHLHPRAQAALGSLFYDVARSERKYFLVETHSDFVIDSYRVRLKERNRQKETGDKGAAVEAQVVYFERHEGGNRLFTIDILEDGELPEEQPKGYRDFFIKSQMKLLGY